VTSDGFYGAHSAEPCIRAVQHCKHAGLIPAREVSFLHNAFQCGHGRVHGLGRHACYIWIK
jgi:hypothetical protein